MRIKLYKKQVSIIGIFIFFQLDCFHNFCKYDLTSKPRIQKHKHKDKYIQLIQSFENKKPQINKESHSKTSIVMISPWTIYKDQKDSASPSQQKKNKNDHSKHSKKTIKYAQSSSLSQNERLDENPSLQNNLEHSNIINLTHSSHQPEKNMNAQIMHIKQNKISQTNPEIVSENDSDLLLSSEDLFKGLNHPQLISEQVKSKDFLKNIVSDPLGGYIDNGKLLQFSKNQSILHQGTYQHRFTKKRRPITNLMKIQEQKNLLLREWNQLILLKYIKSTLSVEQAIERQVDNNIESVLQKLNQEFLPRINPQELLLEKLLKNQQERISKNQQNKSSNKEISSDKQNPNSWQTYNPPKKHNGKGNERQFSKNQIMSQLQQDIQKSSIIKYLNSDQSPYLQSNKNNKKTIKYQRSSKSKQSLNSIKISVNNAKLTEKLIYVSKKPVSVRPLQQIIQKQSVDNHQQPQISNCQRSENDQSINPQHQSNMKSQQNAQQNKDNVQKLIKKHIALRQSRKQAKSTQILESANTIQVQVRKLKGKNYIVIEGSTQQSNLISPKLNKSKTIDLINQYPGLKNDNKKISKNYLQTPLLPPQFDLPQLSHRTLDREHKKMSSSSKLLEIITNNILQQKYKNSKRSSTQNQNNSNSLIDQLFAKNKEKKLINIRRNHSLNIKNTKQILREANRKKFLNLDEQILELKEMQKSIDELNKKKIELAGEDKLPHNQQTLFNLSQSAISMNKDFIAQKIQEESYNFMKRKSNRLTPLETELIGLIKQGNNPASNSQNPRPNEYMNTSAIKFSDRQIVYDMNQAKNN